MPLRRPSPWYREPWPWALLAIPGIAVVGGMITLWLAIASDDGLVADDYYRRGLAINRTLAREHSAAAHEYRATLAFDAGTRTLRVDLRGIGPLPRALRLRFVHPTRAGLDREVRLHSARNGAFEGRLADLRPGRWVVILEDEERSWRLTGDWHAPADGRLELAPKKEGT